MACRCSGWRHRPAATAASAATAALAAALLALVTAAPEARADSCSGLDVSAFFTRFAIAPASDDQLGLDLTARGPHVSWGDACTGRRHRLDTGELDAPDYGDRDHLVAHVLGYRTGWGSPALRVEVGARLMTVWGDRLRFITPVVGVRGQPVPDLALHAEVASDGLFLFARDPPARRLLDGLSLEAGAVWPATATVRGEVRARVRRYRFDDDHRIDDVTLTAGVGLALAQRDHHRALPGFIGLAVRRNPQPSLLLVAELSYGTSAH